MANDFLKGLNAENVEALASQGLITPETYERVKSQVAPLSTMSEEQSAMEAEPQMLQSQPPVDNSIPEYAGTPRDASYIPPFSPEGKKLKAQEAAAAGDLDSANVYSKEAVNILDSMEKTKSDEIAEKNQKYESDLAKATQYNERAQKLGLPPIEVPVPESYGVQKSDTTATDQDIVDANTPKVSEIEAAAAPARKQAAAQIATLREQDSQVASALKREEDLAKKQAALEQAEKSQLERENAEDNPYGNSFGDRLRIALAIGLGSFGKENPALKMIEAKQKSIQENKKLTAEQKTAREKMNLEIAQFELKKLDSATDSAHKRAQIAKIQAELEKSIMEKNSALTIQLRGQDGFSAEELPELDEDTRNRISMTPDGKYKIATNKKLSEGLNDYIAEVQPALSSVDRIRKLSQDYKLVQKLNPWDPQRKTIETEMVALIGNLRLPFTGPGQLLEKEYERLKGALGDPNKILTTDDAINASLSTVANKLRSDSRIRYKQAGIEVPMSREEKEIELLSRKNPDIPRAKLESFYRKGK